MNEPLHDLDTLIEFIGKLGFTDAEMDEETPLYTYFTGIDIDNADLTLVRIADNGEVHMRHIGRDNWELLDNVKGLKLV